ncbi:TPA: UDP-N-acetylmuramate dehydrogenase [Candidatus Avacholeplasma faecigallinarum]|nr:UDP-N-acetylmuramate dehydrogenase [Candidatus Avacholeplasma faecigallinarum]
MDFTQYVYKNDLGQINIDKSFKDLTTIGCGGKIQTLYYPKNIDCLIRAYKFIKKNNLKYFIIGNGSNILASDLDYKGIVICLKKLPYFYKHKDDYIIVSAFYPTIKLANDLADLGLGDLSYLGGVPGLLGGAIFNNAGAYNKTISDDLISIKYIDTSGSIKNITVDKLNLNYRSSVFHYIEGIIIEAKIRVKKVQTKDLLILRKNKRQETQPLEYKSMGSVFKNDNLIPSWKIIDSLNLRGFRIGDAQISTKHTNFIINLGHAKSSEIINLINLIQTRSRLEYGIELIPEITIL